VNLVEQLEAEQFFGFTANGYSRPARVRCARADGTKVEVYVKFIGGVQEREFGLVSELLCSLFARELGLNVPTPFLVNLSTEFLAGVPKPAQDLVKRSLGLNFGSQSLPAGFSVVPPEPRVPFILRAAAAEIFAFDVIFQNLDRKQDNPNLLWDRTTIQMIDHERALSCVRETVECSFNSLGLDRFYDHVFYSAVSPKDAQFDRLKASLGNFTGNRLGALFSEIPSAWQVEADLAKVRSYLAWVADNRTEICDLIMERLS
jgi:hypothetical protein